MVKDHSIQIFVKADAADLVNIKDEIVQFINLIIVQSKFISSLLPESLPQPLVSSTPPISKNSIFKAAASTYCFTLAF